MANMEQKIELKENDKENTLHENDIENILSR